MPPALDTPEEVAAMLAALLGVLGVVGVGIVGAVAAVFAAWRSKLKPLLTGAKDAAEVAAHQLQNNSGSSTRDAIDRTEKQVAYLVTELRDMRAEQRVDRSDGQRAHSEIFHRLRSLEAPSPLEDSRS